MSDRIPMLLVDDEPDMLWALSNTLTRSGYAVVTASNADEALFQLERQPFALAFIDVKLPDMDGLELAAVIKESTPDLAIVMISGYYYEEDPEIMKGLTQRLYSSFIAKPFDLREVRSAVDSALAGLTAGDI